MAEGRSILIADDEPIFRKALANLLRLDGHVCHTAADADEAIDMLRADRYDLLISDVVMPGNENLRLVREAQLLAEGMPVILVSGCEPIDSAQRGQYPAIVAFLEKPLDFDEFGRTLQAALQESGSRPPAR
ncbi:MAG TPA: response regulator [Thermoguttaceae bacterium]|nr:response regulator [Thermoguttaceae bacterium]